MVDYSILNTPKSGSLPAAFQTDFDGLKDVKVKEAYIYSSDQMGGLLSAHTWTVFVTNENKLILARGGALNEPIASSFGKEIGWRVIGAEGNQSFGPLVGTVAYMAEKRGGEASRNDNEDNTIPKASGVLDTMNYTQIEQGKGIDGLTPRSGVSRIDVTKEPVEAQVLFDSAMKLTRKVNEISPEYRMMPGPVMNALTTFKRAIFSLVGQNDDLINNYGANSHSFTSWLMRAADDENPAGKGKFVGKLDALLAFEMAPGSSVARFNVVGRGPERIDDLSGQKSYAEAVLPVKKQPDSVMNYAVMGLN